MSTIAPPSDFIERQRVAGASQVARAKTRYGELLRAAVAGNLSDDQDPELFQVRDRLGIGLDQLERDRQLIEHDLELAEIEGTDEHRQALKAHRDREVAKADGEIFARRQQIEKLGNEIKTLGIPVAQIGGELARADNAHRERRAMRRSNWQLFDEVDPAVRSRQRHIQSSLSPFPSDDEIDTVDLENLMAHPQAIPWQALAKYEFLPLPGQSADEMQKLAALAMEIARSGVSYKYLTADVDGFRTGELARTDSTVLVSATNISLAMELDVTFTAIQRHGQTVEEFEALKADYRKFYKSRTRQAQIETRK